MKKTNLFIAGHRGMTGSSLCRVFEKDERYNLILKTRDELNLEDSNQVKEFIEKTEIDAIILVAAAVGGIKANADFEYSFLLRNMQIGLNVVNAARNKGIKRLINISSAAIYSEEIIKIITEEDLYKGRFAKGTEGYALAKLSVMKMCDFISRDENYKYVSVIPTNLYGPKDNFDRETSHVVAAMIRKFYEAKNSQKDVELWGNGEARRQFLYVDDLANAIYVLLNDISKLKYTHYNVSSESEYSIKELAEMIGETIGYTGKFNWQINMPTGVSSRKLSIDRITEQGWKPSVNLKDGINSVYNWYIKEFSEEKKQ